jgi:hypothetical protein
MEFAFARQQPVAKDSPDILKAWILDKVSLVGYQHILDQVRAIEKKNLPAPDSKTGDVPILPREPDQELERAGSESKQLAKRRTASWAWWLAHLIPVFSASIAHPTGYTFSNNTLRAFNRERMLA